MDIKSLIKELDDFLSSAPKQAVVRREEISLGEWTPVQVVLATWTWKCRCGAEGPATPRLFVREKHGRKLRLRPIGRNNYALLPHIEEELDPELLCCCPSCFPAELAGKQLPLFPENLPREPFLAPRESSTSEPAFEPEFVKPAVVITVEDTDNDKFFLS